MSSLFAMASAGFDSLLGKFSRGGALLASVVVAVGVAVLLVVVTQSGGRSLRPVAEGSFNDLAPLLLDLDAAGIEYHQRGQQGGVQSVDVPAGPDYARALALASHHDLLAAPGAAASSVEDRSGAWPLSPRESDAHREDENLRSLEQWIRRFPDVDRARVFLHRAPAPLLSPKEEGEASAVVVVDLVPGAVRLTASVERAVREAVCFGFHVERERVRLVDSRGGRYGAQNGLLDVDGSEEQIRRRVESVVEDLYSAQFSPWEFRVVVLVDASAVDRKKRSVAYDREKSVSMGVVTERHRSAGGDDEIVVQEEVPYAGFEETHTHEPPGEVQTVSVALKIDRDAALSVLAPAEERIALAGSSSVRTPAALPLGGVATEERLAAYARQQKLLLAACLPWKSSRVEVSIERLRATSFPEEAPVQMAELAWWPAAGYVVAGCLALLLVAVVLRRHRAAGVPASLEPAAAAEGDAGADDRSGRPLTSCEETLHLARDAARMVRERPEVAASVLRIWLAEADSAEDGASRTDPEGTSAGDGAVEPAAEGSEESSTPSVDDEGLEAIESGVGVRVAAVSRA